MFEGTSLFFKLVYFITAMAPAYILFIFQRILNDNKIGKYLLCIIVIIIIMGLGFIIKRLLFKRKKNGVTDNSFSLDINNKNGDVITFLFGVIVPTVGIPDTKSVRSQVIIFLIIQILSFFVIMKGSQILPNIILLLLNVDIYSLSTGEYVIAVNEKVSRNKKNIRVHRLGDSRENVTYIADDENDRIGGNE